MTVRRALLTGATTVALLVGCSVGPRTTFPAIGSTPGAPGDATAVTRDRIISALGAVGLQAAEATRPYRPPEGPLLAAAPRTVLQATLSEDPDHGFIVIYAFDSDVAAREAANDHAAYLGTPVGRIQFPAGARFVLRVAGPTVVFFWWTPGSAPDPRIASVDQALRTVGTEVAIPS